MIESSKHGRVCHIALNRPEKRNALNVGMCRDLVATIAAAEADAGTGAIVLSGNGPSFCAGMDLKDSLTADPMEMAGIHRALYSTIDRLRKPLIAAVHGAALAGGTGLAANAHIVIAHPDARFGLTEVRIGLWPVLIYKAMELAMGTRRTLELSLTGREFNASEAQQFGFVTEIAIIPLERAMELGKQIAGYSPNAISSGLSYAQQARSSDFESAGVIGAALRLGLLASEDYREGVASFAEKRNPVWPSLRGESLPGE